MDIVFKTRRLHVSHYRGRGKIDGTIAGEDMFMQDAVPGSRAVWFVDCCDEEVVGMRWKINFRNLRRQDFNNLDTILYYLAARTEISKERSSHASNLACLEIPILL